MSYIHVYKLQILLLNTLSKVVQGLSIYIYVYIEINCLKELIDMCIAHLRVD